MWSEGSCTTFKTSSVGYLVPSITFLKLRAIWHQPGAALPGQLLGKLKKPSWGRWKSSKVVWKGYMTIQVTTILADLCAISIYLSIYLSICLSVCLSNFCISLWCYFLVEEKENAWRQERRRKRGIRARKAGMIVAPQCWSAYRGWWHGDRALTADVLVWGAQASIFVCTGSFSSVSTSA